MHLKTRRSLASSKWIILTSLPLFSVADAWQTISKPEHLVRGRALQSSEWKSDDISPNGWQSSLDGSTVDWQDTLKQKEDGSFWSSFESSTDGDNQLATKNNQVLTEDLEAEAWLDTLASISAEEVQFNMKEADRANTARQMEEWGFDKEIIAAALDISTDTLLEQDEVQGMNVYRQESYLEDVDLATVESHTRVEIDDETGEPVRLQMVYVDEHTCIGCTNCAMIAQSTFYMNPEHGRARVFQQWGDDDETIQIAIETCPVDCIHYVPYEELVKLEIERRDMNINFKARLVSQAENGNSLSHRVGGANRFTAPQKISGNSAPRCNNCPSRGCKNCPMFGVGKNPEYEKREKARKERLARKRLLEQRESAEKKAEL
ncbi:ferredoxin [Fistulifera solaris]|uniref:Ferredoxin n=1 Tax=Fistulifera solaris TaxID=1519565 RepID=A0A1Z5KLU1_FISSO|nr:ferredoxin [Fistulifera solaris]|eukprot:GAX27249.1 ferredoxin [Fistulifera solaris]